MVRGRGVSMGRDSSVKPAFGQPREVMCHLVSPNVPSRVFWYLTEAGLWRKLQRSPLCSLLQSKLSWGAKGRWGVAESNSCAVCKR